MAKTGSILEVNVADIVIDKGFNFRTGGVDEKGEYFLGIVESIREEGLKESIVVTRGVDGKLHLCDGEHRLRALRRLEVKRIVVIIREYENEAERFIESLVPNIVRARPRPYDIAMAADRMRKYGFERKKIARTLGLTESYIGSLLHCVDKLEPELLDMFQRNDSEATVADLIKASRMEPEEQMKWADDVRFGRLDMPEEKPRREPDGRPRMKTRDKVKIAIADLRAATFIGTSKKKIVATDDVKEAVAMFARWTLGEMTTCPIPEPDVEKD